MKRPTSLLLLFALAGTLTIAVSCSRERPLYPIEDELALLLHGPFENREAEELALQLSVQIIAPRPLYERIDRDLEWIRKDWSDSIPIVNERSFRARNLPGEVVIFLHDEVDVDTWLARTSELQVLREEYGFDSLVINDNRITLRSRYRISTTFLLGRLERLPGVCWAQPTSQSIEPMGALIIGDSIFYSFVRLGIHVGWVSFPTYVWWFKSTPDSLHYFGLLVRNSGDTLPDTFKYLWDRSVKQSREQQVDSIRFRDETPPARATDLKVIGDQVGRTATIMFTSTGDDGLEGAAYNATVCTSTLMINDQNFDSIGTRTKVNPGFSGDEHTLTLANLSGTQTNYFAVRFVDCNQNASRVSNLAQSRNIWMNGWTYLNSGNSPIPNDRITTMMRDSRGRIWLGTYSGLACKDRESWSVYQTANCGIPYDLITSVSEGPDGTIWVGTPQGLGRFDGTTWTSFTTANSAIPKQEIRSVEAASDGTVWIGYGQFGLVRYKDDSWTVYDRTNSALNGITVNAIFCDSRGDVWVGTNYGVTRIQGDVWTAYDPMNSGLGGHYSVSFFEDSEGRIWCGSSTDGVSWFEGDAWQSHRMSGWHVTGFAQSGNGTMWISASEGAWKHADREWTGFSTGTTGLPTNQCTSILTDGSSAILIATADKGLCRWDIHAAKLDRTTTLSIRDD